MKIVRWITNNIFFFLSLFLLAFIPLYPKRPLLDVEHTWVYIRIEDFVVAFAIMVWVGFLLAKKVNLKTPLTFPILLFWIIGAFATLHGVLIIFPMVSGTFSNIALLSFLRRIEYLSLFFVAFAGVKDKKVVHYIVWILTGTLLLVFLYGLGQKMLGFPAYLTMNEEFAKGVPLQLSQLSRIPSTFAGHYDLAAYLVLIVPLLISSAFGFKNYISKGIILLVAFSGFILMSMTVSRVSFFVLLLSLVMLLILQKKKMLLFLLFLAGFGFLYFSPSLLDRFHSTVSEVDVLVDARNGSALGPVKEVDAQYFNDKTVLHGVTENEQDPKIATISGAIPKELYSAYHLYVVTEPNESTGENLPQGTSYVNLPLSPITGKTNVYFFQKSKDEAGVRKDQLFMFFGDYLIKRAKAYDLSWTTRFQGEWPNTIAAFKRNIFLGSGYGSVSLAVDNNYLRILGETGLLGFLSFILIFLVACIYVRKVLPAIDSPLTRNFIIGFVAGSFGLGLNAIFIDVFEASKIAFTYWILMGMTIGIIQLYKNNEIDIYKEVKNVLASSYAAILYVFLLSGVLFYSATNYYFSGDDYTWFRWVSSCCTNYLNYFIDADGFFYRPGTKIYFSLMHKVFWLNQVMYHLVSFTLHFLVGAILFLITKKIFKNYVLSVLAAMFFIVLSGQHEAIFWISSTGFLFNALFALLGILFFIYWKEKNNVIYIISSLLFVSLSLLFHERGVIVPLFIVLYDVVFYEGIQIQRLSKKLYLALYFIPLIPYFVLRFMAQSHWFNGDYSYNLVKLPFNVVGNSLGYIVLDILGPASLSFYEKIRTVSRDHILFIIPVYILGLVALCLFYKYIFIKMAKDEKKITTFGIVFFIISLLPFLGLGNITSRYSYLSTAGIAIILPLLFQNLYFYLKESNDKYLALMTVSIAAMIFSMVHLFQLQKVAEDWRAAGDRSRNFLVSLNSRYSDGWKKANLDFKFINVPIRYGEAWVFPVGLKDAVWHVFLNDNITISQMTFDEAENSTYDVGREKVFVFQNDGSVKELMRVQQGKLVPIDGK